MRLFSPFAVATLAGAIGFASPISATTVYTVSDVVGAVTLGGTITTDGTIGALSQANIVNFDVTFTAIGTTHVTKSNNEIPAFIGGNALSATLGGLFFNFSGAGFFNIFNHSVSSQWFMCASVLTFCSPLNDWFVNGGGSSGKFLNELGIVEIAIGPGDPTASTPLPAALPLFATGLGALGLIGWLRKRKAAAIAV